METDYRPIACSLHDEYEIAIMQKRAITISWLAEEGQRIRASVSPKDLLVRDGEEFLLFETADNQRIEVRLDKISLYD